MKYRLKIIVSTVREGRKGILVADWIYGLAERNENFEVELLDLAKINLPLMDEPNHPNMQQYMHEHTRNWSKTIGEADAFIFVTGEYDYNYPAPLRNALEYLYKEWNFKAAGIVSYGGVSAGTRAAKSLMGDLTVFKMVPVYEAVSFPFFSKLIDDNGEFKPEEISYKAADTMFQEIIRWTKGLMVIRDDKS